MEPTIRRILVSLLSQVVHGRELSDDEMAAEAFLSDYKPLLDRYTAAIVATAQSTVEEQLGAAITKIRSAEGIDMDQIDQVLGVQEEDL